MSGPRVGFVLSGFGAGAASQVGMMQVLLAHRIAPDVVVGVSVGAGNAAFVAARPDARGVEDLRRVWVEVAAHDVAPLNLRSALSALAQTLPRHPVEGLLRALSIRNHVLPFDPRAIVSTAAGRSNYLAGNSNPGRFLRQRLPLQRLEDAAIPLRVLATDAETGAPVALGEGDAVAALQASAAVPGIYPSVEIAGRRLVDGWVAAHTGVAQAVDLGAEEVYVLPSGYTCGLHGALPKVTETLLNGLNLVIEQRLVAELTEEIPGVRVHVVPPPCPLPVLPYDFHKGVMVIERAAQATEAWLDGGGSVPGLSRPLGGPHHHGATRPT